MIIQSNHSKVCSNRRLSKKKALVCYFFRAPILLLPHDSGLYNFLTAPTPISFYQKFYDPDPTTVDLNYTSILKTFII